jgi:hypothetical protein
VALRDSRALIVRGERTRQPTARARAFTQLAGGGDGQRMLVVAAVIIVARLLAQNRNAQASEAEKVALTSKIAVEQPCAEGDRA